MGRKSATETVVASIVAFIEERTWEQAALARRVGVEKRALRRCLDELTTAGVPLERQEDPPRVYWSVPPGWLPGAATLNGAEVAACARLLARLPRTTARDALLGRLLRPPERPLVANDRDATGLDDLLRIIEDAVAQRVAAKILYRAASTGRTQLRGVSVHHVAHGDSPRFVAVCHRDDQLKWFRIDRVQQASLTPADPFRSRDPDEIRAYLEGSFDSYRSGATVEVAFSIRDPEARWALSVLPASRWIVSRIADGVRIEGETAGLVPLARFLVGLGDAAAIEPGRLRDEVQRIARAALRERAAPGVRRATVRPRPQRSVEGGSR